MRVLGGFGGVGVGRWLLPESVLQGAPDGPCRLQLLGSQDRVFHRRQGNRCAATLQESGLTTHCCAMSFGPSGINSPPEGGVCPPFAHPSVGCALRLRRPARRLGRLHGGGRFPRPPWGGQARPPHGLNGLRGSPHPSADQKGRASAARRPKAGGLFGLRGKFQKVGQCEALRGVPGGVPPGAVEGWSTGLSRWAVSGQRAALSTPSTGDPGCPRRNGPQGAYCVQREKGNAGNPRQC